MVVRAIPGPTHRRIPTGNQTGSNSVLRKAVNRQDKLSRRYRDRDLAKFESSRRYRER